MRVDAVNYEKKQDTGIVLRRNPYKKASAEGFRGLESGAILNRVC